MVSQIHVQNVIPTEFQRNNLIGFFFTDILFLDLDVSLNNDLVTSKGIDKRDNFNFEIHNCHVVNFLFMNRAVPLSPLFKCK